VRKGREPRLLGGDWGQRGGVAPLVSGWFPRDGHTRGLRPSAGRVATSQTRACREATEALMEVPLDAGEGGFPVALEQLWKAFHKCSYRRSGSVPITCESHFKSLPWFRQISRQSGFLEWTVKPSPPHVASKNRGLQMEENTVLALLARNLTEPIERHSHAKSSSSLPCMIQADPALPGGLPYCQDRTASRRHSALM
jgi:hypothetical protein